MKFKNKGKIIAALACAAAVSSCGITEWIGPSTTTTQSATETTSDRRMAETTKTAVYTGDVDNDDEGIEGYTSTTSMTGGTLENDYSRPDLYDEDVRATMSSTTTVKTYYTLPNGSGVTATSKTSSTTTKKTTQTTATTTAFKADALYKMSDSMKYSSNVKYKVTSDTTYLNLRFGPSKSYDVQLKIPDGETIYGRGETTDSSGNVWVYTDYNGTAGWVMRELLS